MGCDIHAFIELYSKQENAKHDSCFVDCFAEEVSFGRDYVLFGMLAGVRHHVPPVISPRGLPIDPKMSHQADSRYHITVLDSPSPEDIFMRFNCISRERAELYVNSGSTQYSDHTKARIIDPGWHTPTWLTLDELIELRKHYLIEVIEYYSDVSGKKRKELVNFIKGKDAKTLMRYSFPPHENVKFYAALCTMQALERASHSGDTTTRLVIWFDS
jgi:hypothetical protein